MAAGCCAELGAFRRGPFAAKRLGAKATTRPCEIVSFLILSLLSSLRHSKDFLPSSFLFFHHRFVCSLSLPPRCRSIAQVSEGFAQGPERALHVLQGRILTVLAHVALCSSCLFHTFLGLCAGFLFVGSGFRHASPKNISGAEPHRALAAELHAGHLMRPGEGGGRPWLAAYGGHGWRWIKWSSGRLEIEVRLACVPA